MNPEKENALNESLAMTKLTIDLLNQKKKDSLRLWIVIFSIVEIFWDTLKLDRVGYQRLS